MNADGDDILEFVLLFFLFLYPVGDRRNERVLPWLLTFFGKDKDNGRASQ